MTTKKIIGGVVGVIAVVLIASYIIFGNSSSKQTPVAANPGTTPTGSTPPTAFKDGTYTGTVVNAVYGNIQVVATIQGGKLVDTQCPVQPDAPGHTAELSQSSLPILKQEAIAAQSANVNAVSGATQTSQGYQQSLAAALAMAHS